MASNQIAYSPFRRAGDFVFVSGQVPRSFIDRSVIGGNIVEQTHAVLRNLAAVLTQAGGGLAQLVKVNVYLENIADIHDFNKVYLSYFSSDLPARTTTGAALNGVLIEIDAIAHLGESHVG